ncbi:MAG: sensor histidine kinase [Flavobacteriales bacterium]|nr:sensor histidine kinase [Flavobacteriales bacterium]
MQEQEVREQLELILKNDPTNYDQIVELSTILASFDKENVRFSVDAGIINRLGKELVGRHETAVSELVKNSYDADATEVKLIFKEAYDEGGILNLEDNGVGMTMDQLVNGFMRLSSSDKIHNPTSPKYGRTRAGRKGIGRFATQRLGTKLTVITQTLDTEYALKIVIDWEKFEMDKDLSSITNSIEQVSKNKEEGTSLIIEGLRDWWTDAMIKRVYRYTADLLQPFPLSKERKDAEEDKEDPGFSSSYFRDNEGNKIIDEEEAFLKHALAEIEGYVLADGQGCWALESNKLNFPQEVFLIGKEKELPESKFELIKGIHFKCYYFLYDSNLLPKQSMTLIREVANERGGVRLYRNGFRVLPYGEKLNDWLGLDDSSGQRVIIPSHRNINFFGFVEVSDNSGLKFDETSSREGLFENDAVEELVNFVHRSIISAVLKVADLRGRKQTAGQKGFIKASPTEKVDSAIADLKDAYEEKSTDDSKQEGSESKKEKFKEAYKKLLEGREEEKIAKQALIDENNMLRILASLGLVIGEFVHEVKRFLPGFNTDTEFLKKAVKDYSEALSRVERLEINLKSFTTYTSYFDKAISRNVLRELEPIEIKDAVNDFLDVIGNELVRSGIVLEKPIYEGFDLYTTPMHPSEWASILFNFYTNSKKAIRRKGVSGVIGIRCAEEKGNIIVEFYDNGDGIVKGKEEEIFSAFNTISSVSDHGSSDSETLVGTGLGLKIIRDIIESYGGEVFVSSPKKGFSTTMRIEIPKNQEVEDNE